MIEAIAKLAFVYVITMLFIELAFPAGKRMIKYIYWSAVILIVYIAIAPIASRFFEDIHSAAVTYSESKKVVSGILGDDNSASQPGCLDPLERLMGAKWELPVKGEITQPFKGEEHHGIDYAAKVGTPIKSTRPGRVVKVFSSEVYGLAIVLSHGNGYESLYTHCSEVLLKEGDKVFAGDKIAKTGGAIGDPNAGKSSGPHLHFEVRKDGKAINPKELIE